MWRSEPSSSLRLALYRSIHPDAGHQPPEPSVDLLCQPFIPGCRDILESDHFLGVQRATLSPSYPVPVVTYAGLGCHMAGLHGAGH